MDWKLKRFKESGNVLFLILVAVALFAALSFAVTQSGRSGGSDAGEEKTLVGGAVVTQYPAGVKTSVVRMMIGGAADDALYFNPPSDFGTAIVADDERVAVFHPRGGAAIYQPAPPEVIATGSQQAWIFTGRFQIDGIGTTTTGADPSGNDLIAFLSNLSASICRRINQELAIGGTIPGSGLANMPDPDTDAMVKGGAGFGDDAGAVIDDPALEGQPFGCFTEDSPTAGPFWYYHVLIER